MTENVTENQPQQTTAESFDQPLSVPSVSSDTETGLNNLRAENDRLRTELRLRAAREELTRLLTADRARSPDLLFEVITKRLDFDDDGDLKNTTELLAELKQRFPEQFTVDRLESRTPPPAPPVINAGAGRTGSRLPLTKEALAAMKPVDITRLDWNDVKQVMES